MAEIRNYGILASMSWNSKRWADQATSDDIDCSNYDFVKDNSWMHEDLNFGHERYPTEEDGTYIAYTPMFNNLPSKENVKYVEFVFFRSLDHKTKRNLIVGFYAKPLIGKFFRKADHPYFRQYDWGNVKSKKDLIVLFENPIPISDKIAIDKGYLPKGKELGKMGFNYLLKDNVMKILDEASRLNPSQSSLKKIKLQFLVNGGAKPTPL